MMDDIARQPVWLRSADGLSQRCHRNASKMGSAVATMFGINVAGIGIRGLIVRIGGRDN